MTQKEDAPADDLESSSSREVTATGDAESNGRQNGSADDATPGHGGKARSGTVMAIAALLLAALAAGLSGWLWLDRDDGATESFAPADRVDALASDIAGLDDEVDALGGRVDAMAAGLEELEIDAAGRREALRQLEAESADLRERFTDLEGRLERALQDFQTEAGQQREVDRDIARRLQLMETAGLLRLGQQRAELARDWSGARTAYRRASAALRELGDPRAQRARGLVARELEALEEVGEPDWVAMAAQLARMADASAEWPGSEASSQSSSPVPARGEDDGDDEAGWWTRARKSLSGLVRVRPRDAAPVTAEQVDAAREGLRLRLLAAEMAVARRNIDELSHHAIAAGDLIRQWFDAQASAPARALDELETIADTRVPEVPALGEALAEVNRLMDEAP